MNNIRIHSCTVVMNRKMRYKDQSCFFVSGCIYMFISAVKFDILIWGSMGIDWLLESASCAVFGHTALASFFSHGGCRLCQGRQNRHSERTKRQTKHFLTVGMCLNFEWYHFTYEKIEWNDLSICPDALLAISLSQVFVMHIHTYEKPIRYLTVIDDDIEKSTLSKVEITWGNQVTLTPYRRNQVFHLHDIKEI